MTPPSAVLEHARIAGLDVARALALFGMFAAHVGDAGEFGEGGWRWLIAAHGRASALFAVLAGVSIALMLSRALARASETGGDEHAATRHTRVRIAVRGALLLGVGWLLSALATPVDIILDNLGVMFFIALVALRWRPWVLLAVGGAILALGRFALTPLVEALPEWLYSAPVLHELWGIHYPALIWIGYVFIGMAIGSLRPWTGRALAWLAAAGLGVATFAYGIAAWTLTANGDPVVWAGNFGAPPSPFDLWAHSYSAPEMVGNVGVAALTIAACCAVAAWLPRLTWPLAAAGSMTLTLYTAQVVAIAIMGISVVYEPQNSVWLGMCAVALVFASLWRWKLGQGPLERLFTMASTSVANTDALVRSRR